MPEVFVTVKMSSLELKLFRRAVAKAVDEGQMEWTEGLHRICELDVLRWKAEERHCPAVSLRQPAERRVA